MKKITDKLKNGKVLISDGAWGTFLQAEGLKQGECPELWNVEQKDVVLKIAKSYIDAGSDMIETNTFGGNKIKLEHYGLAGRTYELNRAGAEISREAAEDRIVLGSIGPTGKLIMMGDITEEELYDAFVEQVKGLTDGGVDAFCVETFFDIHEAAAAVKAVKENSGLEVVLTFSFDKTPAGFNTMMGVSPKVLVEKFANDVDVIGTNCSNGFEGMISIVKEMRECNIDIPILVHANAGMPVTLDDKIEYPDTPEIMASLTPSLIEVGANVIGGCCGTTPEHIKRIKDALDTL